MAFYQSHQSLKNILDPNTSRYTERYSSEDELNFKYMHQYTIEDGVMEYTLEDDHEPQYIENERHAKNYLRHMERRGFLKRLGNGEIYCRGLITVSTKRAAQAVHMLGGRLVKSTIDQKRGLVFYATFKK